MTNPSPLTGNSAGMTAKLGLIDPLLLTAALKEAVRQRFSTTANGHPPLPEWAWTSDLKTTKLLIEEGFQINAEARNKRPAIYIDRLAHTSGQVTTGMQDQEPVDLRTGRRRYYTMADMDIAITCQAGTRGESLGLASAVHLFLLCTAFEIQSYFGLRSFGPFNVGQTTPDERDRELWTTVLQFRVNYEIRWQTTPITPLLRDFVLTLQDRTTEDTRDLQAPSED